MDTFLKMSVVLSMILFIAALLWHRSEENDLFYQSARTNDSSLEKGVTYSLIFNAELIHDDKPILENASEIFINGVSSELSLAEYRRNWQHRWLHHSSRLAVVREYVFDFESPVTCQTCTVEIGEDFSSQFQNLALEVHDQIRPNWVIRYNLPAFPAMMFMGSAIGLVLFYFSLLFRK